MNILEKDEHDYSKVNTMIFYIYMQELVQQLLK